MNTHVCPMNNYLVCEMLFVTLHVYCNGKCNITECSNPSPLTKSIFSNFGGDDLWQHVFRSTYLLMAIKALLWRNHCW